MNKNLTVSEVMHPCPHTVGLNITLDRARDMMTELNIRHLPVQGRGKLIGVITDRDIHFALAVDKKEASEMTVEDAYTSDPYVVVPTTSLLEVVSRMAKDHLGCALIAEQQEIVGIFTTVDVCKVLADQLSQ